MSVYLWDNGFCHQYADEGNPRDPVRSSSSFFFCLLLTGPREASRRVEPCWIHVLPACVRHGTLPRASVCSSLSSSFLLASEPLSAAPVQRAHILQHELPHFWPTTTIQLPKGAIRVTVPPITPSSGNGDMILPLHYKTKALLNRCVFILASVCFISLNMFSSHAMKMPVWPRIPRVLCSACYIEAVNRTQHSLWCLLTLLHQYHSCAHTSCLFFIVDFFFSVFEPCIELSLNVFLFFTFP